MAQLHERTDIRGVEKALKEYPGVSVLIFDQTCATEKRRRRKRGKLAEPKARLVINEAVCEDCGDCSAKSTCVAVEPVETAFGSKRRINQSACNKDFTCAEGFCPSFAVVEGAARPPVPETRWAEVEKICAGLEEQAVRPEARADILIAGIGGMGVTTISAILGMAASLDGRAVTTLDMTGLAQKGGAVLAHIRLAPQGARYRSPRIPAGGTGVLLAADPVVSASAEAMNLVNPRKDRRGSEQPSGTHRRFRPGPGAARICALPSRASTVRCGWRRNSMPAAPLGNASWRSALRQYDSFGHGAGTGAFCPFRVPIWKRRSA